MYLFSLRATGYNKITFSFIVIVHTQSLPGTCTVLVLVLVLVLVRELKVKVHTLGIAPLRSERPPQKRLGMTRVLKGSHSFTCTPTRSSAIGMSHTCLCLPSRRVVLR